MKKFAELFKKYRLKSEFETIAAFGNVLAEKGYDYEDSIFSHWQKGTRIPSSRHLVLTVLEIFIEHDAIHTIDEANEFLASAGLGYLTESEWKTFAITIKKSSTTPLNRFKFIGGIVLMCFLLVGSVLIYSYLQAQFLRDHEKDFEAVPSFVNEPKKLVIGVDAALEPLAYFENGKLVGLEVELGEALAKELNADIEFRNIIFDNLFTSLEQRKVNMIISAVTITEERKRRYGFSDSYLSAGQVIIAKKIDGSITSSADLKGKTIATQTGTTNEQEALKYTSNRLVMRYSDFVQATKALANGSADALFTDLPNAKRIIANNPNFKIVGKPLTKEDYGIVFRKGDPSIIQINEALTELRSKGILTDLEKKWLR